VWRLTVDELKAGAAAINMAGVFEYACQAPEQHEVPKSNASNRSHGGITGYYMRSTVYVCHGHEDPRKGLALREVLIPTAKKQFVSPRNCCSPLWARIPTGRIHRWESTSTRDCSLA